MINFKREGDFPLSFLRTKMKEKIEKIEGILRVLEKATFNNLSAAQMMDMTVKMNNFSRALTEIKNMNSETPKIDEKNKNDSK